MKDTTILIPETAEMGKPFTIIFEPICAKFKIELTLKGEDKPFEKCNTNNRSNQASFFMKRPKKLDAEKRKFTDPLKSGDIVIVKGIHANGTEKEQQVTIE